MKNPEVLYSREEWTERSHFESLSDAAVLDKLHSFVVTSRGNSRPVVVLDLDSTLYEVAPRTHAILKQWLGGESHLGIPILESLEAVSPAEVGYSLGDTFKNAGLDLGCSEVAQALASARKFWFQRFFTNDYLVHDRPYEGAVDFIRSLHDEGAEIIYLSGRDEPNMGAGTRANLIRDGFPCDVARTHLCLKPAYGLPDLAHKTGAQELIRRLGTLVASVENEPANLVGIARLFPEAMHVFMDTIRSETPAPAHRGLYRIRGFKRREK
jgi:hypothetical protein